MEAYDLPNMSNFPLSGTWAVHGRRNPDDILPEIEVFVNNPHLTLITDCSMDPENLTSNKILLPIDNRIPSVYSDFTHSGTGL